MNHPSKKTHIFLSNFLLLLFKQKMKIWKSYISILGFPCGSQGKKSAHIARDLGSILGSGRSPRGAKGYPLQHSGLENSTAYTVHEIWKSWTWLSDFPFQKLLKVNRVPLLLSRNYWRNTVSFIDKHLVKRELIQ